MTGSAVPLSLAADFPTPDRDEWRALVRAVLAKSRPVPDDVDPESLLATATYDGFDIQPLYTAADLAADRSAGLPGQAPFLRGATVSGAARSGWDVRQRHVAADPTLLNDALLADLENGVTSLWLVLPPGAHRDLPAALEGVHLDLAPIALDAGAETIAAAQSFLDLLAARGTPAEHVAGTLGADPIGNLARTGHDPSGTELAELVRLTAGFAHLRTATVDATIYHDAGGSDSDELAIGTAVGLSYLRALLDAGLDLEHALGALEFRFAVTADQFNSIAKLRAARRIWSRVADLAGATSPAGGQRQHAVTSSAMMTRRDPWVNLLRTTVACFAAAVGGAESVTVLPFDSAIGLPDAFARRLARNTQAILHDEASLARVIDPAGGSYFVESLSDRLAEAAWDKFTAIERAGGAEAALRSGHIPALLAATHDQRRKAVAYRKAPITGVSEYALITEVPVVRQPLPEPPAGAAPLLPVIRYAEDFEALRDATERSAAKGGGPPSVFLAAIGKTAAHTARVSFAANLFQAAGLLPIVGTGTVEEIAAAFTAAGTSVACVCGSDRGYAEGAAPLTAALKVAGARWVWLAGRAGDRAETDAAAGVDGYVYLGCDVLETLQTTLRELEVH
jgi:methylmalonyl-CoA mutase